MPDERQEQMEVPSPPRGPVSEPQSDEEPQNDEDATGEPTRRRCREAGRSPRRRKREDFHHIGSRAVPCEASDSTCPPVSSSTRSRITSPPTARRMWAFTHQDQVFYAFTESKAGIERELWGGESDTILAERQARSRPLVDGFFNGVKGMFQIPRPRSVLGDALRYARHQESPLRLFHEHGELPLHHHLSERMPRQTVVGRNNGLFARSEGGAKAATTLHTRIGSCSLQGIDPWQYLRDVLDRLMDYPVHRVAELTPKSWRPARCPHTAGTG